MVSLHVSMYKQPLFQNYLFRCHDTLKGETVVPPFQIKQQEWVSSRGGDKGLVFPPSRVCVAHPPAPPRKQRAPLSFEGSAGCVLGEEGLWQEEQLWGRLQAASDTFSRGIQLIKHCARLWGPTCSP